MKSVCGAVQVQQHACADHRQGQCRTGALGVLLQWQIPCADQQHARSLGPHFRFWVPCQSVRTLGLCRHEVLCYHAGKTSSLQGHTGRQLGPEAQLTSGSRTQPAQVLCGRPHRGVSWNLTCPRVFIQARRAAFRGHMVAPDPEGAARRWQHLRGILLVRSPGTTAMPQLGQCGGEPRVCLAWPLGHLPCLALLAG